MYELERPSAMPSRPGSLNINLPQNGNRSPEDRTLMSLSTGTLKFQNSPTSYDFNASSLEDHGPIGSGNFGTVYKMKHRETGRLMAVKRIRFNNINAREQERLVREHKTIMQSEKCPNIVKFYGVIFSEGDCWICMELMDVSLDRLYRRVYHRRNERLSEQVIGHILCSTIAALSYLKTHLNIIHRDVKPSNILANGEGQVKLCDFGICGELENSLAKTHDVGCQPYLAPERISQMGSKYDVRSDVWSLGISAYEICTGEFPYPAWNSPFEQLRSVVNGDAPLLKSSSELPFSTELCNFVNKCLTKDVKNRPKYNALMRDSFYEKYASGGDVIDRASKELGLYVTDTLANPEVIKG